jgi:hypothetical protein
MSHSLREIVTIANMAIGDSAIIKTGQLGISICLIIDLLVGSYFIRKYKQVDIL